MSQEPMAKVSLPDQRDVLFDITHGWAPTGATPNVQQVVKLERAEIVIGPVEMDALRATHWVIARLAECPPDAVKRFLGSMGARV